MVHIEELNARLTLLERQVAAGGGGSNITGLTGDVTATGPGTVAATLATVNASPGTFTNATITVNAKGLVTVATTGAAGGISRGKVQGLLQLPTTL